MGAFWEETRFHLGGRGDVMLGREGNHDWGVGPYAEVMTSFDDGSVGAGVSGHVPVHGYLPLVVSGGGYGWKGPDGWEPGVTGQVFWGSRSFNYHSWYIVSGGLMVQGRLGLGASSERAVVVGLHLDGQVLALPLVLLYESISGSTAE
jgi:hypothetical protein